MNCPRLPTLPSSTVSRIEPSWFRDLFECLQFAMTHPKGDGVTVFNDAGGTLRANPSYGGEGGESAETAYTGSFEVRLEKMEDSESDTEILRIGRGFVNVNGVFFTLEETTLPPQEGFLCVTSSIDSDKREIVTPELEFADPDATHYPVAEIVSNEEGGFSVRQFPVSVAVILITKNCIFAKAAST